MKIVCLGAEPKQETAQDVLNFVNARYALTSSTSQKMLDFYNAEGGNTPLKRNTTMATTESKTESKTAGIFNQITGIFDKLGTIASREPTYTTYKVKESSLPIPAIVGVGLVGFLLYKAVK